MKIAVGLVRPSRGTATVCGAPAGSASARASLGYLAELFRFPGWYSADELLGLHQRLAHSTGGERERHELLELVGLTDARGRRVEAMSKGMQQRLGIAQALIGSPKLLFLDEPTSALDPAGRRTIRRLLEELKGRGISVLLNSHLLSEIELVCDRVVILLAGRVVAEGAPDDLTRARGVEVETDEGVRTFEDASREDAPQLVADLVAAGRRVYAVRVLTSTLEDVYLEAVGTNVTDALTIVGYAIRESVRKKMFLVVLLLTAGFIGLFWLGTHELFDETDDITPPAGVDARTLVGATTLGLGMFGTLFLGTVLAVFLTLSAVRGDAERGLLQPLVVRPLGRVTFLLARFAAAAAVSGTYALTVYAATRRDRPGRGGLGARSPRGARARARRGRLAPGRPLAARLGLSLGDRERRRRLHGLRRGSGRRAARPDRRGVELGHAARHRPRLVLDPALRGPLPGRPRRLTVDTGGFTGFVLRLGPFGGAQGGGGALCPGSRPTSR